MKALVIYDSIFGNTEKVAFAIGAALGGDVPVKKFNAVALDELQGLDILIVGSPTRGFNATPEILDFFAKLPEGALKGVKASSFDTRIPLETIKSPIFRYIVKRGGYADKPLNAALVLKGAELAIPSAGFLVLDREGPVKEGELERAAEWAKGILTKE